MNKTEKEYDLESIINELPDIHDENHKVNFIPSKFIVFPAWFLSKFLGFPFLGTYEKKLSPDPQF